MRRARESLVKICISSIGKRGVVRDYCHIHPAHNYIASRCKQRQVYDLYCGILWYYDLYCGIFTKLERFYAVVTYFMLGSIEMYTASLGPQVSHNLSQINSQTLLGDKYKNLLSVACSPCKNQMGGIFLRKRNHFDTAYSGW